MLMLSTPQFDLNESLSDQNCNSFARCPVVTKILSLITQKNQCCATTQELQVKIKTI